MLKAFWLAISTAFALYSTLPMPQQAWNKESLAYAIGAFPLVGLLLGGLLWGLGTLLEGQAFIQGLLLWGLSLLLTGGIHWDGLADSLDAFGSRKAPKEQLAIMHDSQIGVFAVLGFFFFIPLQVYAFSQSALLPFLPPICWLSRSLTGRQVLLWPKASDGLAKAFTKEAQPSVKIFLGLQSLAAAFWLFFLAPLLSGVLLLLVALSFLLYRRFCLKRYAGITGDLAGAYLVVMESLLLGSLAVFL